MNLPWHHILCGVFLLSTVSSREQVVPGNPQSAPSGKSPIQVFLTASDKHRSPTSPTQSELSVTVDKQPVQINALRSVKNDPLLFAVLVDRSGSDAKSAGLIRTAALRLFQTLSTDGNRGYLVLFNDSVVISTGPVQTSEAQALLNAAQFGGGTAVYDAILRTCIEKISRSANPEFPRRAILLISDGDDNASHVTHAAAEEALEREGVALFSLMVGSPPEPNEKFLKEVSRDTGGEAIRAKNLVDGPALLLAAIAGQWVLSFVPAQPLDHALHSLGIKSLQKDLRVSAPARIFVQ
ncbi:MAG: VWA domain-containing protein [Terriglobales bacterium]